MELSLETIKALLDAFDRSDWREMIVTAGNDRLHVSRDAVANGGPPQPSVAAAPAAAEPAAPEPPAAAPADGTVVESPSVGLFWRAPAPGAAPFVDVGERVASGDTVAIVEVMKLMNHVVAPVDGTVTAILVENGAAVEFGQALVVIDPQA
jgi:acetyl-CoA carboxylase biotin carboxyl carrier protein